jgi:hypothetical protein
VLIPAVAVLERIGLAARVRARKRAFQVMAEGLTDAARAALERLLTFDPALRRSRFAWLRDYSESPAPAKMIALLDRLEYVRGLGIDAARARRIHPARLGRLLDEGAIMTVQHIADLEPARRTTILVAQTADLETRLADATLAMFEKYIGSLFSKAQTGTNGASRPPNATWRRRCCCFAALSRRSSRRRRPERTASPWSIARSD